MFEMEQLYVLSLLIHLPWLATSFSEIRGEGEKEHSTVSFCPALLCFLLSMRHAESSPFCRLQGVVLPAAQQQRGGDKQTREERRGKSFA